MELLVEAKEITHMGDNPALKSKGFIMQEQVNFIDEASLNMNYIRQVNGDLHHNEVVRNPQEVTIIRIEVKVNLGEVKSRDIHIVIVVVEEEVNQDWGSLIHQEFNQGNFARTMGEFIKEEEVVHLTFVTISAIGCESYPSSFNYS